MPEIRIERFTPEMTAESARMLARAFVDNPLHVAAFPNNSLVTSPQFSDGWRVEVGRSE